MVFSALSFLQYFGTVDRVTGRASNLLIASFNYPGRFCFQEPPGLTWLVKQKTHQEMTANVNIFTTTSSTTFAQCALEAT